MRLPSWILCALMTVSGPALSACAGDSVDDSTGPVDDGDDGDDDGDDGDDDGSDDGDGDGDGGGGSPDGGGSTDEACAAPGATGNAEGVGEYCTEGGGECDDNDGATYCTIDYEAGAPPFCTMPCFSADACGEDSICTDDGGGGLKGCVPNCVAEGGA